VDPVRDGCADGDIPAGSVPCSADHCYIQRNKIRDQRLHAWQRDTYVVADYAVAWQHMFESSCEERKCYFCFLHVISQRRVNAIAVTLMTVFTASLMKEELLTRFFHICGQTALKLLLFVDGDVQAELKQRRWGWMWRYHEGGVVGLLWTQGVCVCWSPVLALCFYFNCSNK